MSSQLASIVPCAPLTDQVFPFNQQQFLDIRSYQDSDLGFLSSPPVRAIVSVAGVAGGTATGITSGVADVARGGASTLFGGAAKLTAGIPGSSLFGMAGQVASTGINLTEQVADQLVDPTRVVREHINYSNNIKDNLPGAVNAVDQCIHDFASGIGNQAQELYENIPTQGIQIITGLQALLANVDNSLAKLNDVLTENQVAENLKVGQDKYHGVQISGNPKNYLGEISDELPKVVQTVVDVKAAFDCILGNLTQAKTNINNGVTDPKQIFAENHEDVTLAWQNFEARRKTMTYLPYKY